MPDSNLPAKHNGHLELYTPEIADEICERLASGESLRAICKSANVEGQLIERTGETWFPAASTVCKWVEHDTHGMGERYARVRQLGYDQMAMQTLEIADACTPEDFQPARVRIDTRKWFLSKVDPKRYGDKLTLAGDAESPVVVTEDPTSTARRVAFILAMGSDGESEG